MNVNIMNMDNAYRYAIYAVPLPGHPLWAAATRWFGRDVRGVAPPEKPIHGDLVAQAARYGFHGTLKAPFRLAPGREARDLLAATAALAVSPLPVSLTIRDDLGFPALMPFMEVPALNQLAERCVIELDRFRAPPDAAELARRRSNGLTDGQALMLETWGYPYVLDQFSYHMTLGDKTEDMNRHHTMMAGAHRLFGPLIGTPVPLTLSIFAEPEQGAPFRLWRQLLPNLSMA
ncbi:MAG TPA: DUF1045 domain-containing protein [Stellaceae bacterium]|nr:DUF1045 domain-containing protein [Stellaceae bacterium]